MSFFVSRFTGIIIFRFGLLCISTSGDIGTWWTCLRSRLSRRKSRPGQIHRTYVPLFGFGPTLPHGASYLGKLAHQKATLPGSCSTCWDWMTLYCTKEVNQPAAWIEMHGDDTTLECSVRGHGNDLQPFDIALSSWAASLKQGLLSVWLDIPDHSSRPVLLAKRNMI